VLLPTARASLPRVCKADNTWGYEAQHSMMRVVAPHAGAIAFGKWHYGADTFKAAHVRIMMPCHCASFAQEKIGAEGMTNGEVEQKSVLRGCKVWSKFLFCVGFGGSASPRVC